VAGRHNVPVVQIGLAWILVKAAVTSVIIGATNISQLDLHSDLASSAFLR
jgi:aryl-alcohol dehydrogenase-like predicted oxidoreductase